MRNPTLSMLINCALQTQAILAGPAHRQRSQNMRPRRVHVPFCLLILGALAAPEGRTQESQSGFRAGVEIVEVPVTVLNGKREPVTGLRAEDFTILEDGKP